MGSAGTTPKAAQNLHANELQDRLSASLHADSGSMLCNMSTHHLHMLGRQHLCAAVDEPSHIGWVIRHAHTNVICARPLHLQKGTIPALDGDV